MAEELDVAQTPTSHGNPLFDGDGPLADPQERGVIFATLDSFRRRQNLYALPSAQWQMLSGPPLSILDTLNSIDDALDHNADLADEIVQLGLAAFGLPDVPAKGSEMNWQRKAKPSDMSKAHSTIRQLYRDWSHEGFTREVEPLLTTILSDLETHLPRIQPEVPPPTVLLPGAGLARLLFELALRGYHGTGNEISYHQLLASNFILNCTHEANQYPLYPFAHNFTNVTSRSNQFKRHDIPDVHPGSAFSKRRAEELPVGEMNMTAGDFVLSYSAAESKETFDCVASVFFIDTAPSLIRYVETIRNCLRPGGVWINIGPLLWHFDERTVGTDNKDEDDSPQSSQPQPDVEDRGIAEPGSFELTDEEVIQLVTGMGFEVLKHEILDTETGYIQDPHSLLQSRYRLSHWVAKKSSLMNSY